MIYCWILEFPQIEAFCPRSFDKSLLHVSAGHWLRGGGEAIAKFRVEWSESNDRGLTNSYNPCLCDLVFTLPFCDGFLLVSAGQSLNPGICRLSDHDLRIFEVIWVDVKSPLRISKCPRRIPNSNWIEFPSLHFLTCACFYRRSLHHLKRCRTPNRRGTNKKESDLLSLQILEASWPNESWQEQVLPLDLPPRPPILPETPEEAWFHVKWAGPGLPRTPHHCESSPFDF